MATLPEDMLSRPALQAVRLVALAFLDEVAAVLPRLSDAGDEEALHDFRVGVRRLRTTFRAYRRDFRGSVDRKVRRQLRRLASATNRGRDTEVLLLWVRDRLPRLSARERPGARWLIERLDGRRQEEYRKVAQRVRRDFVALEHRLRRRLSGYRAVLGEDGNQNGAPFRRAAAAAARALSERLGDRLAAVQTAADVAAAHRARVAAKRIRYLLEPLADRVADGPSLVRRFKALQDLMGEFNEMHLLSDEIAAAVEAAAAERARLVHELAVAGATPGARRAAQRRGDERPGLSALARLCAARRDELFKAIDEEWLGGRGGTVVGRIAELADALESGAPQAAAAVAVIPPPRPRRYARGAKPGWHAPA